MPSAAAPVGRRNRLCRARPPSKQMKASARQRDSDRIQNRGLARTVLPNENGCVPELQFEVLDAPEVLDLQ